MSVSDLQMAHLLLLFAKQSPAVELLKKCTQGGTKSDPYVLRTLAHVTTEPHTH